MLEKNSDGWFSVESIGNCLLPTTTAKSEKFVCAWFISFTFVCSSLEDNAQANATILYDCNVVENKPSSKLDSICNVQEYKKYFIFFIHEIMSLCMCETIHYFVFRELEALRALGH